MKNGIPLAYFLYRSVWSGLHLALVALGLILLAVWFLQDGQGVDALTDFWSSLGAVQRGISAAIPFPWGT